MSTKGIVIVKAYKPPPAPDHAAFERSFPGVLELAARLALIEVDQVLPPAPRLKANSRARAFLAWLCRRTRPEMGWAEIGALAGLDWTGMRASFLKLDEQRRERPALHVVLHEALQLAREAMKREVAAE